MYFMANSSIGANLTQSLKNKNLLPILQDHYLTKIGIKFEK